MKTKRIPAHAPAEDYARRDNWLRLPEAKKDVDTFYIYPSSYLDDAEDAPLLCGIDHEGMRRMAEKNYQSQATVFAESTNVFAPFYRQAKLNMAFTEPMEVRDAILAGVPLDDVTAAFDYYIKNLNQGRPFILAGHSQGSEIMTHLLSRYLKEHSDCLTRMIAAYVLGYSVTAQYLADNPHLKFAEGPDDTGVLISWNTEGEKNQTAKSFVVEPGAIAINPLNWRRDETYAGAEACLGSRIRNPKTREYEILPQKADAQLDVKRGVVVTHADLLKPMPPEMGFGPESYHTGDYALWYCNIRDNLKTRIRAYFVRIFTQ